MGDEKPAGVLGMLGGYAGVIPWLVTVLCCFLLDGLAGMALLLLAGASRRPLFPFGPAMLAAATVAVIGWT